MFPLQRLSTSRLPKGSHTAYSGTAYLFPASLALGAAGSPSALCSFLPPLASVEFGEHARRRNVIQSNYKMDAFSAFPFALDEMS